MCLFVCVCVSVCLCASVCVWVYIHTEEVISIRTTHQALTRRDKFS